MSVPENHSPLDDGEVVVIGLGNAGLKTIGRLAAMPEAGGLRLVAVDTDSARLAECPCQNRVAAAFEWSGGLGCGGDPSKGERSVATARGKLKELIGGARLAVVVGGLGGGTASGGAPIVASVCKAAEIPAAFIMTTPFSFEGEARRKIADDAVNNLVQGAELVLPVPNDLLFVSLPAETSYAAAFAMADAELARVVVGVGGLIRADGLLPVDMPRLKTVLGGRKSHCAIGFGRASAADGDKRCHVALSRMVDSPFLGGVGPLAKADVAIVNLIGGDNLQIGEVKKTLESFAACVGGGASIIGAANTVASFQDDVWMVVVAVRYDEPRPDAPPSASVPPRKNTSGKSSGELIQNELPLQNISRGFFTKTPANMYRDEDLDIPTFQRRGIIVDQGKKR